MRRKIIEKKFEKIQRKEVLDNGILLIDGYKTGANGKSLHRQVSELGDGKIPLGWHVHHCDYDRLNNSIHNLVQIPEGLHELIHKNSDYLTAPSKELILNKLLPEFIASGKDCRTENEIFYGHALEAYNLFYKKYRKLKKFQRDKFKLKVQRDLGFVKLSKK